MIAINLKFPVFLNRRSEIFFSLKLRSCCMRQPIIYTTLRIKACQYEVYADFKGSFGTHNLCFRCGFFNLWRSFKNHKTSFQKSSGCKKKNLYLKSYPNIEKLIYRRKKCKLTIVDQLIFISNYKLAAEKIKGDLCMIPISTIMPHDKW